MHRVHTNHMCSCEHTVSAIIPFPSPHAKSLSGELKSPEKIGELRALLDEKFPTVARANKRWAFAPEEETPLDDVACGAVAEMVGSLGDGSLYAAMLLRAAEAAGVCAGVVDGGRAFDPCDWEVRVRDRLLWVRCGDGRQAVKAADLLLRDGNLPLVILDLQMLLPRELARIPGSTWHRFHRLAEESSVALLVVSPRPLVEGARVRIAIRNRWTLDAMRRRRRALCEELDLKVFRRGEAKHAALEEHIKTA